MAMGSSSHAKSIVSFRSSVPLLAPIRIAFRDAMRLFYINNVLNHVSRHTLMYQMQIHFLRWARHPCDVWTRDTYRYVQYH